MTMTMRRLRRGIAAAAGGAMTAAAMLAAPGAAPSAAQTLEASDGDLLTAADLVDVCGAKGGEELAIKARILCYGYLSGAMQFHRALTGSGEYTPVACPAVPATRREAAAALLHWAEARTDLEAMTPIEALMRAAKAEWPCE